MDKEAITFHLKSITEGNDPEVHISSALNILEKDEDKEGNINILIKFANVVLESKAPKCVEDCDAVNSILFLVIDIYSRESRWSIKLMLLSTIERIFDLNSIAKFYRTFSVKSYNTDAIIVAQCGRRLAVTDTADQFPVYMLRNVNYLVHSETLQRIVSLMMDTNNILPVEAMTKCVKICSYCQHMIRFKVMTEMKFINYNHIIEYANRLTMTHFKNSDINDFSRLSEAVHNLLNNEQEVKLLLLKIAMVAITSDRLVIRGEALSLINYTLSNSKGTASILQLFRFVSIAFQSSVLHNQTIQLTLEIFHQLVTHDCATIQDFQTILQLLVVHTDSTIIIKLIDTLCQIVPMLKYPMLEEFQKVFDNISINIIYHSKNEEGYKNNTAFLDNISKLFRTMFESFLRLQATSLHSATTPPIIVVEDNDSNLLLRSEKDGSSDNSLDNKLLPNNPTTITTTYDAGTWDHLVSVLPVGLKSLLLITLGRYSAATSSVHRNKEQVVEVDLKGEIQVEPMDTDTSVVSTSSISTVLPFGKRTNISNTSPVESVEQDISFPYIIPENIFQTLLQIIPTCSVFIRKMYILPICAYNIMTKKGSLKHSLILWLTAATDIEPTLMTSTAITMDVTTTTSTATTSIIFGNFSVELFGNIWGIIHLQKLFDMIISELLLLLPTVFNKPTTIEPDEEYVEIISLYFSTLFLLFRHASVILTTSPTMPTLVASGISQRVKEFRDNCIDMIINLLFHDILIHSEIPYRKNKHNSINTLSKKKKMILDLFFQNLLTILLSNYHSTSLQDFIKQLFTQLAETPVEYHGEHSLKFFVKGYEITHVTDGLAVNYGKMMTYYQYHKVFPSPHFQRMFDFCWVLGDSQFESLKSTVAMLALFIPESEDCVGDATTSRNDVINSLVMKCISLCKADVITSSAQKKTEIVRCLTLLLDFTRLLTGECTDIPVELSSPEHLSNHLFTLTIHIPGGSGMRCRASPLHSFHALKRFIKSDQCWSGEVILDNSSRNINMNLFLISAVSKDKKIGILVARNIKSNTVYNISLNSFNNSIHSSLKLLQSHSELYHSLMVLSSLYHGDIIGELSQQLLAYLPIQLPSYHNLILKHSMSLQHDMSWLHSFTSKPLSEGHSKLCLLYNRYYDMKLIHSLVKDKIQPMRISSRSMSEINFVTDDEEEVEQLVDQMTNIPINSQDWAAGFLASGGVLLLINDASSIIDRIDMNLTNDTTSIDDSKVKIYQDMLQVSVDIIHLLVAKVTSEDLKESSLPLTSLMLNIIRICPSVTELPLNIMSTIFKDSECVFAFLKQPDLVTQFQQALNYSLLSSDTLSTSSQSHYIDILSTIQTFFTAEILPEKQTVFLLYFEVCLSSCLSMIFGHHQVPPLTTDTFGLLKNCFAVLFSEVIQDALVEDNVEETMKVEVDDIIQVCAEVEVPQSPSRSSFSIKKFVNNMNRLSKTILDNKKIKNSKKSKNKSQSIPAPTRVLPRLLWLFWHSLLRRPCYDYHLITSYDMIYGQLIQLISSLLPYASCSMKGKLLYAEYCIHKQVVRLPMNSNTSSGLSGGHDARLTISNDNDDGSDSTVTSLYYLLTIRLNLNSNKHEDEKSKVVDSDDVLSHDAVVADVCVISRSSLCNGIIIISKQNRSLFFDLLSQLLCDDTLPIVYSLAQIYNRCYEFDLRHLLHTSPRQIQYYSYPELIHRFKHLKTSRTGLVNQGNTCYMNSLLQQLNNVSKFSNQIINIPLKNKPDSDVLYQLQVLFYSLQESVMRSVDTFEFCKSCSSHLNIDDVNSQQDCEEFMSALFSDLEGTLKDTTQGLLVQDTFRGSYRNVVRCHECGHESATEELFYNIDLDIKGNDAITASLLQLISPEILQGDCAILCSNCQRRNAMTRTTTISSLADVVVMHLKRFEYDLVNYDRNKINAKCTFPLLLNMEPFMSIKNEGNSSSGGGGNNNIYKLSGVIVHCGTAQGGHYYSYVRDTFTGSGNDSPTGINVPDNGIKEQQEQLPGEVMEGGYGDWTRCNDSMVDPITDNSIRSMLSDWFGSIDDFGRETFTNAYMLFYIRTTSTESCDSDSDNSTTSTTSWEVVSTVQQEEVRVPIEFVHSRNSTFFRDCLVLSEENVLGFTNLMQHSVTTLNNVVLNLPFNQTILKINHVDIQISNIFEKIFQSMILFLFITAPRIFRENSNDINFHLIRNYIIYILSVDHCCYSNCNYLLQLLVGNSNFMQSIWLSSSSNSSYYQETFLLPIFMKLCDIRRNDIQWLGEDLSLPHPTDLRNNNSTTTTRSAIISTTRSHSIGGGEEKTDAVDTLIEGGTTWIATPFSEDNHPTHASTTTTLSPTINYAKDHGYSIHSNKKLPRRQLSLHFSDNITIDHIIIKDVSVSINGEKKSNFNIFVDTLLYLVQLEAERSNESSSSKQAAIPHAIVLDLSIDDSVTEIPPHNSTSTTTSIIQLENVLKLLLYLSKVSGTISKYFIQSGIIDHLILLRYDSVHNYYHVFQLLQLLFSTSIISQVELEVGVNTLEEKISSKNTSTYQLQLWYGNNLPSDTTAVTTNPCYYSLSILEIDNIMSVKFIEKLLLVKYATINSEGDCVTVSEDKINCYCEDIWLFVRPMFGGYYHVDIRHFINMLMHILVINIPVNTIIIQDAAVQNIIIVGCELLLVCCSYQLDVYFSEMNRKINLIEYIVKILLKLLLRNHHLSNHNIGDDESLEAACANFFDQLPPSLSLMVLRHKAIFIILKLLMICKEKKDLYCATVNQMMLLLSNVLPDMIWSCCCLENDNHKCKLTTNGFEHMKIIMNCIDAYIYEKDEEYLTYQKNQRKCESDPHLRSYSNESITRKRTLSKTLKSPSSPSANRNRNSNLKADKVNDKNCSGVGEPTSLVTGPFSSPPVPVSMKDGYLNTTLTPSIIAHTSRLDLGSWPRKRNRANTLTTTITSTTTTTTTTTTPIKPEVHSTTHRATSAPPAFSGYRMKESVSEIVGSGIGNKQQQRQKEQEDVGNKISHSLSRDLEEDENEVVVLPVLPFTGETIWLQLFKKFCHSMEQHTVDWKANKTNIGFLQLLMSSNFFTNRPLQSQTTKKNLPSLPGDSHHETENQHVLPSERMKTEDMIVCELFAQAFEDVLDAMFHHEKYNQEEFLMRDKLLLLIGRVCSRQPALYHDLIGHLINTTTLGRFASLTLRINWAEDISPKTLNTVGGCYFNLYCEVLQLTEAKHILPISESLSNPITSAEWVDDFMSAVKFDREGCGTVGWTVAQCFEILDRLEMFSDLLPALRKFLTQCCLKKAFKQPVWTYYIFEKCAECTRGQQHTFVSTPSIQRLLLLDCLTRTPATLNIVIMRRIVDDNLPQLLLRSIDKFAKQLKSEDRIKFSVYRLQGIYLCVKILCQIYTISESFKDLAMIGNLFLYKHNANCTREIWNMITEIFTHDTVSTAIITTASSTNTTTTTSHNDYNTIPVFFQTILDDVTISPSTSFHKYIQKIKYEIIIKSSEYLFLLSNKIAVIQDENLEYFRRFLFDQDDINNVIISSFLEGNFIAPNQKEFLPLCYLIMKKWLRYLQQEKQRILSSSSNSSSIAKERESNDIDPSELFQNTLGWRAFIFVFIEYIIYESKKKGKWNRDLDQDDNGGGGGGEGGIPRLLPSRFLEVPNEEERDDVEEDNEEWDNSTLLNYYPIVNSHFLQEFISEIANMLTDISNQNNSYTGNSLCRIFESAEFATVITGIIKYSLETLPQLLPSCLLSFLNAISSYVTSVNSTGSGNNGLQEMDALELCVSIGSALLDVTRNIKTLCSRKNVDVPPSIMTREVEVELEDILRIPLLQFEELLILLSLLPGDKSYVIELFSEVLSLLSGLFASYPLPLLSTMRNKLKQVLG